LLTLDVVQETVDLALVVFGMLFVTIIVVRRRAGKLAGNRTVQVPGLDSRASCPLPHKVRRNFPLRATENRFARAICRSVRAISISVRRFSDLCGRFPVRAAIFQSVRVISRSMRANFPYVRRFSHLCGHFSVCAGKTPRFSLVLAKIPKGFHHSARRWLMQSDYAG
jgi:hypothetical protein